ncbi:MAG: hypothetical protein ACTSP3_01940 [Candidatus Heimdallarchaeaceae archaeon]
MKIEEQTSPILENDLSFEFDNRFYRQVFFYETINLKLNNFNISALFFQKAGDKFTNMGMKFIFIFSQVEVEFDVERLFQDTTKHNIFLVFTYPERF